MKKNNLIIALFLCLMLSMSFSTIDPIHDVEKALVGLRSFYEDHPTIYQELNYQLYANHTTSDLHSVEKGLLILGIGVKYSKLGPIESLTNEDYNIGVDHSEKTMMISNNFSSLTNDPLESIAAYLNKMKLSSIKSVSSRIDELSFQIEDGEIEEAQIQFQKTTFEIEKIILKYRREIQLEDQQDSDWVKPRLEIDYSKTSFEGRGKAMLNMNAYVNGSDKSWTAIGKYSSYQLINNLHENPLKQ